MGLMQDPSGSRKTIVVLGGGPAGVFTACGLRDLDYAVTVISRPRPYPAWEGMSERPLTTLRHFGFEETVCAVGPQVTRAAHWNGTSQAQNREYIINRQAFDQALLRDAADRGVTVIRGRVKGCARGEGGWLVAYHTEAGPQERVFDFLVEARGREVKAGHGIEGDRTPAKGQKTITGPATSALLKSYRVPEGPPQTAVASFAKGWAWHLRDGQGSGILQIFIQSDKGSLPPKAGLSDLFDTLVAQLPEAGHWLEDAVPKGKQISVRTAAARKNTDCGGQDFLVVGDGAMALDPLSGNGLFYALGSGLAAAPVINSLLQDQDTENSPLRQLALDFYQERIDLAFEGGCAMGREFYALEARWPEEPFWIARRNWPQGAGSSHPDPLSIPAKVQVKPVVQDGLIAAQKVIVTADHPRGVWQVDGVPLVALLERMQEGSYDDQKNAIHLHVNRKQVEVARKWLVAYKLIEGQEN